MNKYMIGDMDKRKIREVRASNVAHKRLQDRAIKNGDEQKQLYHGACIIRQENAGRVLTREERKKVFNDVIRTFY